MVPPVRYCCFSPMRRFGIELELDNNMTLADIAKVVAMADTQHQVLSSASYVHSYNNEYWHVKFDRSCSVLPGVGGWEVASYVCKGRKDLKHLRQVTQALKKNGCLVNKNCAYHIHGEVHDLSLVQLSSVVAWFTKIEPMLCEMTPVHRRDNKYCRLLRNRFEINSRKTYEAEEFWRRIKPRQPASDAARRVTLNCCNVGSERRTIEFRLPDCTLEVDDVMGWLRLFLRFLQVSRRRRFPTSLAPATDLRQLLGILGLTNEHPFLILSQALYETKRWICRRLLQHASSSRLRQQAQIWLDELKIPPPVPVQHTRNNYTLQSELLVNWCEQHKDEYHDAEHHATTTDCEPSWLCE